MVMTMATSINRGFLVSSLVSVALGAAATDRNDSVLRECIGGADAAGRLASCTRLATSADVPESTRVLALYHRGVELRRTGRLQGAIDDYTTAIRLDPRFEPAYVSRGVALLEQGKIELARKDLDQAIVLAPRDFQAWHNRAVVNRRAQRNEQAIEDFSEAIRLNPGLAEAWNGRGTVRQSRGDLLGATQDFGSALKIDPNSSLVLNNRAVAWRSLGRSDLALADLDQALEHSPSYAIAHANRGAIWRSLNEPLKARQDLDRALTLNPSLGTAYFNRGVLELGLQRFEAAASDLSAAAEHQRDGVADLWLYLVRTRIGVIDKVALASALGRLERNKWPVQIGSFLIGEIKAQELVDRARGADLIDREGRLCEARFFIAEQHLIEGNAELAVQSFKRVTEICPKGYVELDFAALEIARLTQKQSRPNRSNQEIGR